MYSQCVAYISRAFGSTNCTSGKTSQRRVVYNVLIIRTGSEWSKLFRNASACASPEEGCYDVELAAQRSIKIAAFVVDPGRKRNLRGISELSYRPRTIKIASSQPVQNVHVTSGLQHDTK